MSHEERAAEYLWQRDEARAKVVRLERENERLRMLLEYANAAAREEFRLRVAERATNSARASNE